MTYTPIERGTTEWDIPVNAAFVDQDSRITSNDAKISVLQDATNEINAMDMGLITQNWDVATAGAATSPTFGTVYTQKVKVNRTSTITSLAVLVSTAGTMTPGQNFLGIYDSTGALIGQTADQSTAWSTVGYKSAPLLAPVVVQPGYYYLAFLANGSTLAFIRGSNFTASATLVNFGLPASTARFAQSNPASTVLPTSISMGTRTPSVAAFWMGAG